MEQWGYRTGLIGQEEDRFNHLLLVDLTEHGENLLSDYEVQLVASAANVNRDFIFHWSKSVSGFR